MAVPERNLSSDTMFGPYGALRFTTRTFLLCLLSTKLVLSEDSGGSDSDGYYKQFSSCVNAKIEVNEMKIVCSTPGQYYYGSSSYRNAVTCQAGDRATYEIEVYIPDELPDGTVPYITVDVEGYGTVEDVRALDSENLCSLDGLWSVDGVDCPEPGRYQVSQKFDWGEKNDEYTYTFRPHMVVGLANRQGSYNYNLGGANTNSCENGSLTSWSSRFRRSVSTTVHTFIITLGVLLCLIVMAVSGYWYVKRKYIQGLYSRKETSQKAGTYVDDDDDYMNHDHIKRIAMMGRERDLIDA